MLRGKDRPMPGPSFMSREEKVSYLNGLRQAQQGRPSGSRPPPPSRYSSSRRPQTDPNDANSTEDDRTQLVHSNTMPCMSAQKPDHDRPSSISARKNLFAGRPLIKPPITRFDETAPFRSRPQSLQHTQSVPYVERGSRWMEKQESQSLRHALEEMDSAEEEKLYTAAQDEAAELVLKHQTQGSEAIARDMPYANPDIRQDYHAHLRKGSYQKVHNREAIHAASRRSISGGSAGNTVDDPGLRSTKRQSARVMPIPTTPATEIRAPKRRTPSGKSYGGLAEAVCNDIARAHRRISSGSKRIMSGEKKKYMHPQDRIYEDPQQESHPPRASTAAIAPASSLADPPRLPAPEVQQQPAFVRKNPFTRVRMQAERLERSRSEPVVTQSGRHDSIEMQKNPPFQSRRPWYMSNEPLPPSLPSQAVEEDEVSPKQQTPTKEIRSDDIRAATSKARKDYSPKLPRPTLVSDKPGRPIVSFTRSREEVVVLEQMGTTPSTDHHEPSHASNHPSRASSRGTAQGTSILPQISVDETPASRGIPTIVVPDDPSVPSIVLPEEPDYAAFPSPPGGPSIPTFTFEPPAGTNQGPTVSICAPDEPSQRPHPASNQVSAYGARPIPHHAATSPLPKSTPHFTPTHHHPHSNTLCASCALPIAGRILSAANQRFHPSCFTCHACATNLELVAFYPEPTDAYTARQEEHQKQHQPTNDPSHDPFPRFYCHLDFHELFSPRCKSCRTPIEGEVILACGAEWHVGHFFCAQCGDPFGASTPFVEDKEGYAWCVGCHARRFGSKCRGCRRVIVAEEKVVKALGAEWCEGCFVCVECRGGFEDGKFFLKGDSQDPVCVGCEERRLKA